jgi:hypothetical protein
VQLDFKFVVLTSLSAFFSQKISAHQAYTVRETIVSQIATHYNIKSSAVRSHRFQEGIKNSNLFINSDIGVKTKNTVSDENAYQKNHFRRQQETLCGIADNTEVYH